MTQMNGFPARYMAFDVGCIECGEGSGILGFYESEASHRRISVNLLHFFLTRSFTK